MKLHELVAQSNEILNQIIENGGELSAELEEALTYVEVGVALKVDGYGMVIDRLKVEADYWKAKAEIYTKVSKSCAKAGDRLKGAIKDAMKAMDKTEVKGIDSRFKLSQSKPTLTICEDELPAAWLMETITVVPDTYRIRAALLAGQSIPGCELRASHSLRKYINKGTKGGQS